MKNGNKKRVLIIDDEEELCMLMELVLERRHFAARSIHTLGDSMQTVKDLKPDYIFLDNHLPDGLGIDFIPTLINSCPNVKIVMMTAHDEHKLNERALHQGASYFLHKPFNRNNIENIINSL
ncbi:MAG: response regulator [Bacteroidota bacterium]|nr:response regulator [Bacteroidota bacterium]